MTNQLSTTDGIMQNPFDAGEIAGWKTLRASLSEDTWESVYEIVWDIAPRTKETATAIEFLFDAYAHLDDDFTRASALLLLARLSVFLREEERIAVYQRMMDLEAQATSFLRSQILQIAGLFCHILENSMLVAGQLTARRPETNPFCAMAHTRALKRAFLVRPEPAIEKAIARYQDSSNIAVRTEAHVQVASVRLMLSVSASDRSALIEQLNDVAATLAAAHEMDPERPDAIRLIALTEACQALTAVPINRSRLAELAQQLRSLWQRSLADNDGGKDSATSDLIAIEAIERIIAILGQVESLPQALDASAGLVALAEAAVFLAGLSDLGFGTGNPSEVGMSLLVRQGFQQYVDVHVKRSLWSGLQHAKVKVQTLLSGNIARTSPDSAAYFRGVLGVFADIEAGAVSRFDSGLLITLARALPKKTPEEIEAALIEHQARGSLERFLVETLASITTSPTLPHLREYLGGYPKVQRIFHRIHEELLSHLADESPEILANFMNVLLHVLRYLVAVSERKIPVDFLMSKLAGGKGEDAAENDLEESLHLSLLYSDVAYAVRRQPNAATGRVDLALHFGDLFFPLEVKREKRNLSRQHLRDEYLAQAASYTRAYNRLGLFLVLDLTAKSKGDPLVDLENLVWLTEMVPRPNVTALQVNVPDFVVTCVVPGNQPRPSDLSSYSS